jgi:REP element-mobilizing transposase RayT
MARRLRIELAGGWYHVTARGNEQRPIYRDERDRRHFLELLPGWLERFRARLHCYVLMDNHYHLLLETLEANLSSAMHWFNTAYTVWFNRRHRRVGHLFQGRFKGVIVEPQAWGLSLSRYLHLNPARTRRFKLDKAARRAQRQGLSDAPEREVIQARLKQLREYRWSSYRAYVGLEKAPLWLQCERVLALGGGRPREQRVRYREYVEKEVREGLPERPWEELVVRLALGSREFVEQLTETPKSAAGKELKAAIEQRPDFAAVRKVIEGLKDEPWEQFAERHGDWGRDLALYLGQEVCGLTLPELGAKAGGRSAMAVSMALKRLRKRLATDKTVVAAWHQAKHALTLRGE